MKNAKAYTVKHWAPLCELLKKIMNLEKKEQQQKKKKKTPLERSQDKNLELLSIIRCCIIWSK